MQTVYLKSVKEATVFNQLWIDVKKLGHTHCSSLADIWVIILQKAPERLRVLKGISTYDSSQ